jgi:pimeloyl-ACP methyl ester carboxylesterase
MSGAAQLDRGAAQPIRVEGLAALDTGTSGRPVVLLVPGYTGTKEDFGPILDAIATAGFRAVALDLPGQYESPGPEDPDAYATAALGSVLCAVAAALGPDIHLLGHSFGGLVARAAVLQAPAQFRSLVLMDSGPAALGGERAELISHLEPLLAEIGVDGVYELADSIYAARPDYVAPPPELADLLRERFLAGSPAMLQGMGRALRFELDRVDELAALELPTLVIYGACDDAWLPAVQDAMASRLGAAVAVIPDAAHSPAVENPAPTARALIEFWRGVDGRATLE